MLRNRVRLSLFSALAAELAKIPAYLSYQVREAAEEHVQSAAQTVNFLKGDNSHHSPEIAEKRRQHKEMYDAIQRHQARKSQESRQAALQHLGWKERIKAQIQEAKTALSQATSAKAGHMALLQHCTASHAAEVAMEQGIDVKNVSMVLEKRDSPNAVGYEEVVVGYIEAPAASSEEVMVFAKKLESACPVASRMTVEWRSGPAAKEGGASSMDSQTFASGESVFGDRTNSDSSSAVKRHPDSGEWSSVPAGMPGGRHDMKVNRFWNAPHPGDSSGDDALHLPRIGHEPSSSHRADSAPLGMPGSRRGSMQSPTDSSDNNRSSPPPPPGGARA